MENSDIGRKKKQQSMTVHRSDIHQSNVAECRACQSSNVVPYIAYTSKTVRQLEYENISSGDALVQETPEQHNHCDKTMKNVVTKQQEKY